MFLEIKMNEFKVSVTQIRVSVWIIVVMCRLTKVNPELLNLILIKFRAPEIRIRLV